MVGTEEMKVENTSTTVLQEITKENIHPSTEKKLLITEIKEILIASMTAIDQSAEDSKQEAMTIFM